MSLLCCLAYKPVLEHASHLQWAPNTLGASALSAVTHSKQQGATGGSPNRSAMRLGAAGDSFPVPGK